jgi:hypothetical protein
MASSSPAHAGPVTITGQYTISETYNDTQGAPRITGDEGTGITNIAGGTSGSFSFSLTAGGWLHHAG